MLEKFWPLLVLLIVGLLALGMLTPWGGEPAKEASEPAPPPGEVVKTDLEVGTGKEAKTGDEVEVHYTGTFRTTGEKFDSSRGREPYRFPLGGGEVIKGWDKGIVGMKEGGKRKLVIHSDLAYGAAGRPGIPPNADLVFEVELVKVR